MKLGKEMKRTKRLLWALVVLLWLELVIIMTAVAVHGYLDGEDTFPCWDTPLEAQATLPIVEAIPHE